MNHADSVPVFFTSTTAVEGPINAAVELHSVLSELHICVDTTCVTHTSSGPCLPQRRAPVFHGFGTQHRTLYMCKVVRNTLCTDTEANSRGWLSSSVEDMCWTCTATETKLLRSHVEEVNDGNHVMPFYKLHTIQWCAPSRVSLLVLRTAELECLSLHPHRPR